MTEFSYDGFKSAIAHGNSVPLCQSDNMLLVSIEDGQGNFYMPGNHISAKGPYTVHVIAWAPKPITTLRISSKEGFIVEETPASNLVERSYTLRTPDIPGWYRVEFFGNIQFWGTAAFSNPFFIEPRPASLEDWKEFMPQSRIHRYHAKRRLNGKDYSFFKETR